MGFDVQSLAASVAAHGRVVRVVIAGIEGSSPREPGAAMLVWSDGQSGTIGGGALEYEAARAARAMLTDGSPARFSRHPLGPELGQCCGGAVSLLSEVHDAETIAALNDTDIIARPAGGPAEMPMAVARLLSRARNQGAPVQTQLVSGWLIEPRQRASRALWVWGAGHVGRAIVTTLAPLPRFDITWIDTAQERFPDMIPAGVTTLPAADPALLASHAPDNGEHLILTYSHALDLELCHRLLGHGFAFCGLIGSKTKWARFRSRLAALGHTKAQIARITCPIGAPGLGKEPQAIAIGVASDLISKAAQTVQTRERTA